MGSAVHDVTDTIGLTDFAGQEAAEKRAAEATAASTAMTQEQLDFQREQYNDWKDIYGTMQEQEADYVSRYSGEDVVAGQIAQTAQSFQSAGQDLTRTLAQRGISGSGMEAAALTQLAGQQASSDARIRSSQDDIASAKRTQFLGLGLGQGTQMLGTISNVANTGASAQASIAGQQASLSGQLGAASIGAMSNVVGSGLQAYGSYAGGVAAAGSDSRFKDNKKLVKTIGDYNIYTWDWNELAYTILGYTGTAQGVIAQEILEIIPDAVVKAEHGYYLIRIDKLPKEVQEEINYGV